MSNNLEGWDVKQQQRRADFMEHMYEVYKPDNHCYTGLWKHFCLTEAGPYCRNIYFERVAAMQNFLEEQQKLTEIN